MFARVKQVRQGVHDEYLQIVENYRDGGRVRQRLVMYVGHYSSIEEALKLMPKDRARMRRRATEAEQMAEESPREYQDRARVLREEAESFAEKLEALRTLVNEHPNLIERDRERVERHRQREADRARKRRETLRRSDQHKVLSGA
jgi:predicted RNase H-like nuclease (RuvC/YqgF family)